MKHAGTQPRRARVKSSVVVALLAASSFVAIASPRADAITTVPSKPRSVTATAGPQLGQVGITWVAPSSAGGSPILDYIVQRSTNGGATFNTVAIFGPSL